MKLSIVTWGEVGNNIVTASAQEFRKQGIATSLVGILKCKDHPDPTQIFRRRMVKENPDVVLWWFWACEFDFIKVARDVLPNAKFVMFNWDDPHCWTYELNKMKERLQYFDMALTCSSEKLKEYQNIVPESYLYFPPFSPKYHRYEYDEKYTCDVSFICTNLYGDKETFPNQFIDRRSLLQAFEASPLTFHLYGPEGIREAAPTSYQGPVDFAINRKVFSSSKVNICTHVIIAQDYLNERVVTCLASKGLLLTDPTPNLGGFLEDGTHLVTMKSNDPDKVVQQARDMISKIEDYEKVKQAGMEAIQRQHVSKWVGGIVEKVNCLLDPQIVVLMHGYSKESVDSLSTEATVLVSCKDGDCGDDTRVKRIGNCNVGESPYIVYNRMLSDISNHSIVLLWHKDMRMKTEGWETLLKNAWNPKLLRFHTPAPLTVVTRAFVQRFHHVAYASPIHDWVGDITTRESDPVDIQVEGYKEEKDSLYDSQVMQDIRKNYRNQ